MNSFKKIAVLNFLFINMLQSAQSISTMNLAIVAANKENKDATILLSAGLKKEDMEKATFQKAITKCFGSTDAFQKDLQKYKSALGSSSSGTSMTQDEIKKIIDDAKINVKEIKSKQEAKNLLVDFFEKGLGSQLIKEIYGDTVSKDVAENLKKLPVTN